MMRISPSLLRLTIRLKHIRMTATVVLTEER